MARPVLLVLAGVNGAGKSSIGGSILERDGLAWFNPDTFAREWMAVSGCTTQQANAVAWNEGLRRLDAAVAAGKSYAFETTLGGATIAGRLRDARATHDVEVWFCGLASPEQHIARVRFRVERGGHDIPEANIRARFATSRRNLIALMPHLAFLSVYDNSAEAAPGAAIPDPVLVLQMEGTRVLLPDPGDRAALAASPEWAKPLIEAALAARPAKARSKK
jgi:predicted ABC-type ATPase